MKDVLTAPALLLIGADPTYQHPLVAWQMRSNVRLNHARLYLIHSRPIKLTRQATAFVEIPESGENKAAAVLAGEESALGPDDLDPSVRERLAALRDRLWSERGLVILCGSGLYGRGLALLGHLAERIPGCKWVCLGEYANSRGAADMGLYPDLLPGYTPLSEGASFQHAWEAEIPAQPGLNLREMIEAAKAGGLKALYVVGSNPVARGHIDPFALRHTFMIVQDLFQTETAQLADVVLPATSAYEKAGTFTNTCGDLQTLRKAAEVAGPKSDLEITARIAQSMGYAIGGLVKRGRGVRADMGQSRGAQSGEVDRQAVWAERQGIEPRLGPFDPEAVLEEIRNLVPAYGALHVDFSGRISADASKESTGAGDDAWPAPSEEDLFSSGTLGRYCSILSEVLESRILLPYEHGPVENDNPEPRPWNDPGGVCPGS